MDTMGETTAGKVRKAAIYRKRIPRERARKSKVTVGVPKAYRIRR